MKDRKPGDVLTPQNNAASSWFRKSTDEPQHRGFPEPDGSETVRKVPTGLVTLKARHGTPVTLEFALPLPHIFSSRHGCKATQRLLPYTVYNTLSFCCNPYFTYGKLAWTQFDLAFEWPFGAAMAMMLSIVSLTAISAAILIGRKGTVSL